MHSQTILPRVLLLVSALLLGACSKQAEGERCDTANDDSDCESGLLCRELPGEANGAICCPTNTRNSEVCSTLLATGFSDDVTAVLDAGPMSRLDAAMRSTAEPSAQVPGVERPLLDGSAAAGGNPVDAATPASPDSSAP